MCTGVLLQGRVLSVFVGQSIGANNHRLALIYLRISCIILAILSVIVTISWSYTQQVWERLGQPTSVAKDAGYYSLVFRLMIPAQIGFDQLAQFFSAQRIMKPEVVTSLLALGINLAFGLFFVLGAPFRNFRGFGFAACPVVTVIVDWFQFMILFGYYQWFRKHDSLWKHITNLSTWLDGITKERISRFSRLYFPAALALSSDFWRMGVFNY